MEESAENILGEAPEMSMNPEDLKMPELPSMEEFMKILDGMKDMSDEEKEQLKRDLMGQAANKMKVVTSFNDYIVFIVMITLIASVFVFFGYKLYKSLVEKERKREEKLKAKQMKKKK